MCEVAASPTHAHVDADDPEKLPGPEVKRTHFIERNVRRDEFADEGVFVFAETKLSEDPDAESDADDDSPRNAAREQERGGGEDEKDDVHRENIE